MKKRAHILGVCGTFMGSLAILLKQSGWLITGSDKAVYPPMNHLLADNGIDILEDHPDLARSENGLMVIGNVMSRANATIEAILDKRLAYISGPELLGREILANKHVIAISGTHGKTTTTSMLAWILEYAGHNPGFLIGGSPGNFSVSARNTNSNLFVIEADEYDTAFFDKHSKFLHYRPSDLLINNIEFDHADIFCDLQAIQTQFHHLVRTVPGNGTIVWFSRDTHTREVLDMGCWSQQICIDKNWQVKSSDDNPGKLLFLRNGKPLGTVSWSMQGRYNASNALASIVLANNYGVPTDLACEALTKFKGVARRQQLVYSGASIDIYDDFAHHPTSIAATLEGLREQIANRRLIALVHLSSNTMRSGNHERQMPKALKQADVIVIYQKQGKSIDTSLRNQCPGYDATCYDEQAVTRHLSQLLQPGDCLVIMSNGNLGDIRHWLTERARAIDKKDKKI